MATKLKNLRISKVDFVDEGANPDAHIKLTKSKGEKGQSTGENGDKNGFVSRLFGFIGKKAGMNQEEIDSAVEEVLKGNSVSFNERFNEIKNRKIADEIWDICYALQASLCSILNDEELDSTGAATAMNESLDEFTAVVKEAISNWSGGKVINIVKSDEVTESDLAMMKSAAARLNDNIEKAQTAAGKPAGEGDDPEVDTEDKKDQGKKKQSKGDNEDMKIDKSKMTQAELLILEDIEKRYGVADDPAQTEQTPEGKPAVTKSVEKPEQNQETPADGEDIYKGLNPAVKAEIEALRKFREDAENRELEAVAGKYEIIGKKKEELVPMLKSLRATGGTAYNDMIAVLDATVEAVNNYHYPEVTGGRSIKTDTAHFKIGGVLNPDYTPRGLPYSCYITAILHSGAFSKDFIESYKGSRGINALLNIIENYRKKLCYEDGKYAPGKTSFSFKHEGEGYTVYFDNLGFHLERDDRQYTDYLRDYDLMELLEAMLEAGYFGVVETLKNTIKKTSKKVSESDTTKEPQSQEKQGLAGAMNEPETGADEDQAAADDEAVDIPEATAILTADLFNLREYISEDDFYNLQEIVINCELAARKGGENENNRS